MRTTSDIRHLELYFFDNYNKIYELYEEHTKKHPFVPNKKVRDSDMHFLNFIAQLKDNELVKSE